MRGEVDDAVFRKNSLVAEQFDSALSCAGTEQNVTIPHSETTCDSTQFIGSFGQRLLHSNVSNVKKPGALSHSTGSNNLRRGPRNCLSGDLGALFVPPCQRSACVIPMIGAIEQGIADAEQQTLGVTH